MPYLNQEKKKELAPLIKSICKKHGIKATLSVTSNRSILNLNIKSGSIDFDGRHCISSRHEADFAGNEKALSFLSEICPAMNIGNHDSVRRLGTTDYHDKGWYTSINVGNYDKPYILKSIN